MMKYTKTVNEIKTLRRERWMINVCLNEMCVRVLKVIARGDLYGLAEIHRHDFSRLLARHVKGVTTSAAARIKDSLARE